MILLINCKAFSQKMILTEKGDTVITYTVTQSKFLLQQYYKEKESRELAELLELNLSIQDSIVVQQRLIIGKKDQYIVNLNEIIDSKDEELSTITLKLNESVHKTLILKKNKWIFLSCGLLSGIVLTHLNSKY